MIFVHLGGDRFSIKIKVESLETVQEFKVQSCGVRYLGRKYGEEKEKAFNSTDIFVFPTFYSNECFPLVLLEAMQYGLPCVTTDEGGIRDIVVQDSGFTVHGSTPQEIAESTAEALEKLIESPALKTEMGKAGRKRLEEMFTEEVFEGRMKEIILNQIQ